MKKAILIITDGIGHNPSCDFNAFCNAKTPTYDMLFEKYPNSLIKTFGRHVGLPDGQMGNSEVGHMSIGSGRVLYQDLVKVNLAIENDTLKNNKALNDLINRSNTIHLIGLVSDGGVHSHIEHIKAIANIAKSNNKDVLLHAITDGRDVSPTSAIKYIKDILNSDIKIATISGRFYSMDRDSRWQRVEDGFRAIYDGEKGSALDVLSYIDKSYEAEIYDEFIKPASFNGYSGIKDGDGVVFCNFISDRAREMTMALVDAKFDKFQKKQKDINLITLTQYDKSFNYPVMFEKEIPQNTLSQIISKAGLRQLHVAETEKYAHVTFFFNGGVEEPLKNEDRVLIPSPKVSTYDQKPQMSANEVADAVLDGMDKEYDFIVVNFANGDMVGHTGVYEAGVMAVESVDKQIDKIYQKAIKKDYSIVLTSDHGNCEKMKDENGKILTNHTVGDVFCFVIDKNVSKIKNGSLENIAPTILKLMGLEIPKEMSNHLIF